MDQSLLPVVSFSALAERPMIEDWLIVGPFVVVTGASFEREYMFERHKILDIDYLAPVGGEAAVRPTRDQVVPNAYLGPAQYEWQRIGGPRLRLDGRAGELLYRTVQRNCVFYLATYVECEQDEVAFVEAYHSGMKLFLNGLQILNQPYGGAKGLRMRQMLLPVRLRRGPNLFLAKVRPGYIADGVEFTLREFTVTPATLECCGVVASAPASSGLLFGPESDPRGVLEVRCANLGATPTEAKMSVGDAPAAAGLQPGESALLRMRAARAAEPTQAELALEVGGERAACPFTYTPVPVPDLRGTGFVESAFHFDTTYHEEQRVYAMGAFDIVRRYCEQFERDPNFKGTLAELDYLKPYFDMFPAHRALLRQVHREGRAESDCFYNQPQATNAAGETFVRNLLYGQLFHEDVLGRRCYVFSPGDVFGHPAQMSQIAAKGGCTGVAWGKNIYGFPPLFRHASPDGTSLIHCRGGAQRQAVLRMGITSFHSGCDKTPPTDWLTTLTPNIKMSVPSELHDSVAQECHERGVELPLTSRDMSLYHAGTALSRIELKIGNRIGENLLLSAEKFSAFAGLLGARYPERPLDKAWRQLLCGQHHDSITGTHNEISYVDLMIGYREACELAQGVLADALAYLSGAAKSSAAPYEVAMRAFNAHAWERTDVCRATVSLPADWTEFGLRDAAGKAVPCQVLSRSDGKARIAFVATVPSLGYTTYYLTSKPEMPATATECREATVIENSSFRIVADEARGGLVSIFDKRANRELLDSSGELVGGELSVHKEYSRRHEPPHEFYTTGQAVYGHDHPAKVHVLGGGVVQTLVIEQQLGDTLPAMRHEISLIEGVDRVDCRIMLADYQAEDDMFVVTYPTQLAGAVPTFDDRYCAATRRESRNLLDFRTHQAVMFSGCAVYPADHWLEYGPSLTLDLGGARCSVGMTALISPAGGALAKAADRLLLALTTKGIPVTPYPDADQEMIGTQVANPNDDLLYHDFRFVLTTAANPNRWGERVLEASPKEGTQFRAEMKSKPSAFFAVDADNREQKPMKTVILGAPDAAGLETLIESIAKQLAAGETVQLPAVAAASAQAGDYGVCLVNTGNIACSVERGGVVALLLCHTAGWYGATGNIQRSHFVPEHRTHVYTYSLFPHAGSWRQAQVYRQALEVNDPILAVAAEQAGNALPETASLLSVNAPGVVVTAVKAFGNPLASMQGNPPKLPERGLALRFYEADGRPAKGVFRFLPQIANAFAADLIERKGKEVQASGHELPFACGPFAIETYGVITQGLGKAEAATLGEKAEPAQPVFVRSWEHDAGTMPMGYETVVASLGRDAEDLPDGSLRVNVNVVNDYMDAPAAGEVHLLLPEGWTAEATTLRYDLKPLGHVVFPVTIKRPSPLRPDSVGTGVTLEGQPEAAGQVKLRFEHDGQEYQDVLEVGKAVEPNFALHLEQGRIVAAVENPGTESLECEVAIASPVETWGEAVVGPLACARISPRTVGLSVEPGERREVAFEVQFADEPVLSAWWAVGKLMANGRIYLRRVDRHGPAPNQSANGWRQQAARGLKPTTSG